MRIGRHTTLFFDASVLVAGSHSPGGGAGLVLEACRLGGFVAQTMVAVVSESLNALRDMPELSLARFHHLLTEIAWQFLPVPAGPVLSRYHSYVDAGDVHVLAAAVEAGSEFLLTLDRRHLLAAGPRLGGTGIGLVILTPGDFIAGHYPHHDAFESLPRPRRG